MMTDVIFAKTRYQDIGYQSYNDLWRLVELAGYPVIYVDQIDPQSDNTYIFSPANGETVNGWPDARATIIQWQLEWELTDEHNPPPGVRRVWCSDAAFAKRRGYEYVPMGSDVGLCEIADEPPYELYDVALLSYQTPRRQIITEQLRAEGLSIAPNSGLSGWARSMVLLQSAAMVHTHQTEQGKGIAPLRWCIAAAHRLPMITEQIPERGIFTFSYMVQAEYRYLASFAANMLKDRRLLNDYGLALHHLLCRDYTFVKAVESHV